MFKAHTSFTASSLSYTDSRIISFNEGDIFFYLGELSSHWWWGRTKSGDIGLLPADHLTEVSVKSRKDATFKIRNNFKSAARHEIDVKTGDIVQVIQGNSSLSMWLVKKEDGTVGLVPSLHLEAYSSSQQEYSIGYNIQPQITNDLRFFHSNTMPTRKKPDPNFTPKVPPRNFIPTDCDLNNLPDKTKMSDPVNVQYDALPITTTSDSNYSINIPDELLPIMDSNPETSNGTELDLDADTYTQHIDAVNNDTSQYEDRADYNTDEHAILGDTDAKCSPQEENITTQSVDESIPDNVTQESTNINTTQSEEIVVSEDNLTEPEEKHVPPEVGAYMIDMVRSKIQISYTSSCTVVDTILNFIQEHFEEIGPQISAISRAVELSRNCEELVIESQDEITLCENRNMIKELVGNYQERGWAVQSDQQEMILKLDSMISLLSDGDPRVVSKIAREDDYSFISDLATFYSTEKRPILRRKALTSLSLLCIVDPLIPFHLQGTTLASYLPNDLCDAHTDLKLSLAACKLSSVLFANGESIPIDLYDAWNDATISTLLRYIEDPLPTDIDELLPEVAISTVLSFNQHFTKNSNNPIMNALAFRLTTSRNFIDLIMLYLNRDINPLSVTNEQLNPVQKILRDLLSDLNICTLFDQTDIQLLFDMFMRKITDLPTNSPHTPLLIYILGDIIKTKLYTEIQYRIEDVRALFNSLKYSHISTPIKTNIDAVKDVVAENPILIEDSI